MAQGGRLYRGRLQLADSDRDHYATVETATPRHPSETLERLTLRLLAFALLHEDGLTFRPGGVSNGEWPDLAVRDPHGAFRRWIDVGTPDEERLRKASRHARVTVVTHDTLLRRWRNRHQGRLPQFRGDLLVLEASLVKGAAEALADARRFRWQATITGDTVYLETGHGSWCSPLIRPIPGDNAS